MTCAVPGIASWGERAGVTTVSPMDGSNPAGRSTARSDGVNDWSARGVDDGNSSAVDVGFVTEAMTY